MTTTSQNMRSVTSRSFLPKSLFGRAVLILVLPLILVQVVTSYVFLDRHVETVTQTLSQSIASEISYILNDPGDIEPEDIKATAAQFSFIAKISTPPVHEINGSFGSAESILLATLEHSIKTNKPIRVYTDDKHLNIVVPHKGKYIHFTTSSKRLVSRTTPLVLFWAITTSVVMFIIALIFLRNQIRPIRKLAAAANLFGRGVHLTNFKPAGAREVRQAATAFNKMLEKIHRQVSERTDMLAGISHDLRTPLTRMKLELEMLPKSNEIEALKEEVHEMEKMVEGFLAFVRGDTQELSEKVNLHQVLSSVAAGFKHSDLIINLTCPLSLDLIVRPSAFKRAFQNLMSNASHHASQLNITAEKDTGAGGIRVQLDDNGPGIAEEQRENVFKPFYRCDTGRNLQSGGIGLGLSITRDIILNHGGRITLGESPEGGLQVEIILPA